MSNKAALTIAHLANHGPTLTRPILRTALDLCNEHRVDSAGLTEAYRRNPYLSDRPLWDIVVGHSKTDPHRGPKDNPILVSARHEVTRRTAIKACGRSLPHKWAPERWTTGAVYDHELGTVEHIAVHPNAQVQGRFQWRTPRARKFREQMRDLERRIEAAQKAGHLVVVTGDVNYVDRRGDQRTWTPYAVYRRCGLKVWSKGVDAIAYDARLQLVHRTVIDPSQQGKGQDHPWMIARFGLAPHAPKAKAPAKVIPVAKPKPPIKPYARTTYDGKTVDELTKAALEEAARRLGYDLTLLQGSYNGTTVAASAGTHAGGGVIDLAPYQWQRKVKVLREIGFAAWHRTELWQNGKKVWGEHIHAVLIGDVEMAPAAARQVTAYRNGRDGLADNAVDKTWRPNPIPTFKISATR